MRSSPPADAVAARSKDRRRAAWRLSALAAGLMLLFAVGLLLAPHSANRLRRDINDVGAWAPLAMVAIYAVLNLAFVPGSAFAGASGLLFGAMLGTGLVVVSAALGACLAFLTLAAWSGVPTQCWPTEAPSGQRADRGTRVRRGAVCADRTGDAVCVDQLCSGTHRHRDP